jgi:hypothetical protein
MTQFHFQQFKVRIIKYIFILSWLVADPSMSQTITLNRPTPIYLKGDRKNHSSIIIHEHESVFVTNVVGRWVELIYKGKEYVTDRDNIYAIDKTYSDHPNTSDVQSTCDYGHPYSGSNIFFDRPLAQFRHSTPLGWIFGKHERYPC